MQAIILKCIDHNLKIAHFRPLPIDVSLFYCSKLMLKVLATRQQVWFLFLIYSN
jgi:hypothetical protein